MPRFSENFADSLADSLEGYLNKTKYHVLSSLNNCIPTKKKEKKKKSSKANPKDHTNVGWMWVGSYVYKNSVNNTC